MSHLYFNEERDYSEENTCESLSLHHFPLQKETKHIHVSAADILYTVLEQEVSINANARSSHWCSITNSVLKNFTKFAAKQLRQSLFFNKVVGPRQLFLQNNSGQLRLKCRNCQNEAREIDCLCCIEVNAMLLALAKIPERGESMSSFSFYGHPEFQSYGLALSTMQMNSYFGSWFFYLFVSGVIRQSDKGM